MIAHDIIAAIATPPGRGGIGIVRVSGRDLRGLIEGVAGRVPPPREATLADFRDDAGAVLDQGGPLELQSILKPEILAGLIGLAAISLLAIPLKRRFAPGP